MAVTSITVSYRMRGVWWTLVVCRVALALVRLSPRLRPLANALLRLAGFWWRLDGPHAVLCTRWRWMWLGARLAV